MPVPRDGQRRFLVTWRDGFTPPAIHPVGCLVFDGRYRFFYLKQAGAVPGFRPFPNFPELDGVYTSARLFPFFSARVMDRRRPERAAFVQALDLPEEAGELDVLSRNEGARKGDGVAVIEEPAVGEDGRTSYVFVVRGLRFALPDRAERETALEQLHPGACLTTRTEKDNTVNSAALQLTTDGGQVIGWVPDALVPFVNAVLERPGGTVVVQRRNGPEQPAHARVLAHVSGTLPVDFLTLPQLATVRSALRDEQLLAVT